MGTGGARGEIWALGLRNPFTFAVQPGTGTIFINDVGSNAWEEVNRAAKGGNYGWPAVEGDADDPDFIDPVYSYPRGSSASIAGGAFYQATQFPGAYSGNYFLPIISRASSAVCYPPTTPRCASSPGPGRRGRSQSRPGWAVVLAVDQ